MSRPRQWQSSTTATYRLPLWWPPEMVLVPTAGGKIFTSLDSLADQEHLDDCRDLTCGGCVEEDE